MVEACMEFFQLFVGERGDDFGVASRIEAVGKVGSEVMHEDFPKAAFAAAHGSFHFVVDNSLKLKGAGGIFGVREFEAVSFL